MSNVVISKCSVLKTQLKEARLARGYTQTALSEQLGITRQAVSQYEIGLKKPGPIILESYSRVLDFPIQYFYQNSEPDDSINTAILYRSLATSDQLERDQISIRAKWMKQIAEYMEQYLEFPTIKIDQCRNDSHPYESDEIEQIARDLRRKWELGIGPIDNLIILMQNHGAFISRMKINAKKSDACSRWSDDRPYVFLTADKHAAVRSRFDLAHELGHLVLHHVQEGSLDRENLKQYEKEANRFAGAFLLPEETFGRQIISTSIKYFLQLKKIWGVSVAAMIYRCKDLDILSENQTSYLWRQMAANGWRKKEPLDDELVEEEPTLFKDGVEILVNENIVSAKQLFENFWLSVNDICGLCNVSESLFTTGIVNRKPQLHIVK